MLKKKTLDEKLVGDPGYEMLDSQKLGKHSRLAIFSGF